jgi:hypothetical protein
MFCQLAYNRDLVIVADTDQENFHFYDLPTTHQVKTFLDASGTINLAVLSSFVEPASILQSHARRCYRWLYKNANWTTIRLSLKSAGN